MMPHPERTFYRHQHPDWTDTGLNGDSGDGQAIFESVLEYVCKKI
ncbi:MAG: phosphoribosylformylglycinamidine synthase subunit PurQ, partial [Thermoplasmatales archaeon]|nr:phosphoribosylformylglycinamidine synthase subunit PurQ [Thermoplasmatales archaeon]